MQCFITRDLPGRMEASTANTASRLITLEFLLAAVLLFPFQISGLCRVLGYNLCYMQFRESERERERKVGGHFGSFVSAEQRQTEGKSSPTWSKSISEGEEEHR